MLDYSSPNVGLDEIVFEYRNKEYGAYDMRKRNGKNSATAMFFAIGLLTLALVGPLLASLLPQPEVKEEAPVTLDKLAAPPPLDPKTPPPPPPPANSPPPPKVTQVRFVPPEVVKDEEVTEEVVKMEELVKAVASVENVVGDPNADPGEIVVEGATGGTGDVAAAPVDEIMTVNEISEYPGFPGGDEAMIKFLQKNIKYPQAAIRAEKQGKVFLEILVEKDGTISETKVVRGIGFGLDEEATRAVKSMPKWTPGKYNGNSVRVKMNIPISFSIASAD